MALRDPVWIARESMRPGRVRRKIARCIPHRAARRRYDREDVARAGSQEGAPGLALAVLAFRAVPAPMPMRFDVYGRYVLIVERHGDNWRALQVGDDGKRGLREDIVIPN